MKTIHSYDELFDMRAGAVVQDAEGRVWCLTFYQDRHGSRPREAWLIPFSDEYAFMIQSVIDPRVSPTKETALGDVATLPLTDLGIQDSVRQS